MSGANARSAAKLTGKLLAEKLPFFQKDPNHNC